MTLPSLKPCPWCGGKPNLEAQYDPRHLWGSAYVRCSCRMKPLAAGYRSTGYFDKLDHIRLVSNEKAVEEAIEDAARKWNTRAPADGVSVAHAEGACQHTPMNPETAPDTSPSLRGGEKQEKS